MKTIFVAFLVAVSVSRADVSAGHSAWFGPVSVNLDTGRVQLRQGATLDDASAAFWNAVETKKISQTHKTPHVIAPAKPMQRRTEYDSDRYINFEKTKPAKKKAKPEKTGNDPS